MTSTQAYQKLEYYKTKRLDPGGFLKSILSNDLIGAVRKADAESKPIITTLALYCWRNLPQNIWGDKETVEAHLTQIAPIAKTEYTDIKL
jgi:hypothetical protein